MSKEKAKNVIEYWLVCGKLKEVVRTGWMLWRVKKDRLESVAEHIYGTQMLAIAIWSEYEYDLDIKKVITMLACHELEEIKIGDMTPFDDDYDFKSSDGHLAVEKILGDLAKGEKIKDLVFEFDARETKEAKFAYMCDKMEANLQSMLYNGLVDLNGQNGNKAMDDKVVKKCLQESNTWCEAFIKYGREKYQRPFDKNFEEIAKLLIEMSSENSI